MTKNHTPTTMHESALSTNIATDASEIIPKGDSHPYGSIQEPSDKVQQADTGHRTLLNFAGRPADWEQYNPFMANGIDPDNKEHPEYTDIRNMAFASFVFHILFADGFSWIQHNKSISVCNHMYLNIGKHILADYLGHYDAVFCDFIAYKDNLQELDRLEAVFNEVGIFESRKTDLGDRVKLALSANYSLPWKTIQINILPHLPPMERAQLLWFLENEIPISEHVLPPWWDCIHRAPESRRGSEANTPKTKPAEEEGAKAA